MYTLFTAFQNDLHSFFRSLSSDDIRDCCAPSVYRRGEEYFEEDAVTRLTYNDRKTLLKAVVCGNDDYTVTIALSDGNISGSCTCPFGDVCKHLVATLLYVVDDGSEFEIERIDNDEAEKQFHQYLQNLSKNELVTLLEKFASEQFRTEVNNKFTNTGSAQKSFQKAEQKIRKLFDNDHLMYAPYEFGNALDNELDKLSGLEKSLGKEIEELIFFIIQRVDEAFDEGYLYDHRGDDYYYGSQSFNDFVVRYVACLSSNEKTTFLAKLDEALDEQSYSTFEDLREIAGSVFSDNDLPNLKEVLMTGFQDISVKLAGKYFDRVSDLLSYDEKVAVLDVLSEKNEERIIQLAVLHDANGNLSKAIETLNSWLTVNSGSYRSHEKARTLYLDLLAKGKHDLTDVASDAITNCPTDTMLSKIISLINDDPARYELLLEKKNADAMLRYLQKEKRLPEALDLIKRKTNISESLLYDFFRAHKTIFPDDTAIFFCKIIDKNLQNTGDRYYEAIADAIRQLAAVNRAKADEHLNNIRTNYKRRRNLIAMLSRL